jgi:glycerol kinase
LVTVAVDAGTTGVRALVVDQAARVVDQAYAELTTYYPRPGWVEQDPDEIWHQVRATLDQVGGRLNDHDRVVRAIGITNQRETVVAWNRRTGQPSHRAIVWQDRRTAETCVQMTADGRLPLVRERTGLVLDPYFSATKMRWLLGPGGISATGPNGGDLALGTVDSWVLWNLTGGVTGGLFATDASNAARTLLFDIVDRRWSEELGALFGVPLSVLPDVRPCCGRFGALSPTTLGADSPLSGVPISGMAGDQHAALFGQCCFDPGMTKATVGTGTFVLMNAGPQAPAPVDGLVTTLAWDLGTIVDTGGRPPVAYAQEGSVFVSGAGVQWLRDGLELIDSAGALEPLALTVETSEGVVVVPAFTGLGSPYWDPEARGTITGLSRGTGRAHLARAMVEAMSYQVRDVVETMTSTAMTSTAMTSTAMTSTAETSTATAPTVLRVDGGAAAMDLLLQSVADQTRLNVVRPSSVETTAIGAATLAGLAEGVWGSLDELADLWTEEAAFTPVAEVTVTEAAHRAWLQAVARSRHWSLPGAEGTPEGG